MFHKSCQPRTVNLTFCPTATYRRLSATERAVCVLSSRLTRWGYFRRCCNGRMIYLFGSSLPPQSHIVESQIFLQARRALVCSTGSSFWFSDETDDRRCRNAPCMSLLVSRGYDLTKIRAGWQGLHWRVVYFREAGD